MYTINETQLATLTQGVYGRAVQVVDVSPGSTYHHTVVNAHSSFEDDHVLEAVCIGHIAQRHAGVLLNDMCARGMMMPGDYRLCIDAV